jgi:hypothetical protein
MCDALPQNLSALGRERLQKEKEERDKELTPLFRRWPALSKPEEAQLRRLHDERIRLAKHSGARRRGLAVANGRSAS